MSGKRKNTTSQQSGSGKKKQTPSSAHQSHKSDPTDFPLETTKNVALIAQDHIIDLDQEVDRYCQKWAAKCSDKSNYGKRAPGKEDVHLDGYGMNVVASFNRSSQLAAASGHVLDHKFVEMLVLVLRSDSVHANAHVSYSAYTELMSYLNTHPYATCNYYPPGSASSSGTPFITTSPQTVWVPIENDKKSFTSKYLLVPDISISGKNWKPSPESKSNGHTGHRRDDGKWGSPLEMIAYIIENGALKSAEVDLNGDLLLLQYLLVIVEQDLNARLEAFNAYETRFTDHQEKELKHKTLLENSLAWKIFAKSHIGNEKQAQFIRNLVRLIVGDDLDLDDENALNTVEVEPEDDAPASACIFTRRELSALGSRLLNIQMRLFGAAEGSGFFLATSRHRTSSINYRMSLDSNLLKSFWVEMSTCKRPEAARILLKSLHHRDALRLLGFLAATKFDMTYDVMSMGAFGRVVGDLKMLHDVRAMLDRGGDLETFYEVDVIPVLASLYREPHRAVKAYKSVDHLAVMVGSICSAVNALLSRGESVKFGDGGHEKMCKEMHAALCAIASLSKEGKKETVLSSMGYSELVVAEMAVQQVAIAS